MVALTDDVCQRADHFAKLVGKQLTEVLSETISVSLSPLGPSVYPVRPVSALSDGEVLRLTRLQREPEQDCRLSGLLLRQQAGEITAAERRPSDGRLSGMTTPPASAPARARRRHSIDRRQHEQQARWH